MIKIILSKQQQCLLKTIRDLGAVRRSQLYALAGMAFKASGFYVSSAGMDAMLRQLRCLTEIRLEGDLVKTPGSAFSVDKLEAIDVMLELAEGELTGFSAREPPPVLLRFSLAGVKPQTFAVADMTDALPQIGRYNDERVILLPKGDAPLDGIILPDRHFFALRQQDGSHRFYSAVSDGGK